MALLTRAVLVHRRTELDELLDRHGTRGAAEFFLRSRGRVLAPVQERHDRLHDAVHRVWTAVPDSWRRGSVERGGLDRFVFEPDDVVVVVGQDGLVANVAKYLHGQPVVGVDPEPGRNPGVLVPHGPDAAAALLPAAAAGAAPCQERTMVRAVLDDGQSLEALNEVYVGHPGHQSARYRLAAPAGAEPQASSGIVASTGTGATGWAASLNLQHARPLVLPGPTDPDLAWFVREAWPSPTTGTGFTNGLLGPGQELEVTVETEALVVFGDGIEADRLTATWGQRVTVAASGRTLRLVAGAPGR